MNITPDVVKYEFIGLQIRVVKSTNPCVIGTEGKILDETRNTFTILHNNKEKVVVKAILNDEIRHHQLLKRIHEMIVEKEALTEQDIWDWTWQDSLFHGSRGG